MCHVCRSLVRDGSATWISDKVKALSSSRGKNLEQMELRVLVAEKWLKTFLEEKRINAKIMLFKLFVGTGFRGHVHIDSAS